ncbi:MAG: TIGR03643 family protein [Deltaproteobacteria bacterium]|nr:MAG: TIGR03643 family protein [Deltaproteobacteria bacterium]
MPKEQHNLFAYPDLEPAEVSHIIELAWADEVPFDAIELLYGLREKDVIALMRRCMKASSFRMWRKRVSGRKTKHAGRLNQEKTVSLKRPNPRW